MNLRKWKPKKQDVVNDLFNFEHPFFGLSLFPSLSQLNSQLDGVYPAIDISEDDKNVYLKADLPGLKKEKIQVSVDGTMLTLRGERNYENEERGKDYHRIERSYGHFQRSLDLGTAVDTDQVKAKYHNGVLEITAPKSDESLQKKINVE